MGSLSGKVAVVTGSNRGIGKAVARRLAEEGAGVVMAVRDTASGEVARGDIAGALGGEAAIGLRVVACDVADHGSVEAFGRTLEEAYPEGVHVLVNNAGILEDRELDSLTIPIEMFERHLQVNVVGQLRVTRAVLPLMRRAGWGRIVNVSSVMGQFEGGLDGGYTGYRVSKAALNALTKTMAHDLRDEPILLNAMHPGWVRSRMSPTGPETPESAAETALHLATLPDDGPSGRFWRGDLQMPW